MKADNRSVSPLPSGGHSTPKVGTPRSSWVRASAANGDLGSAGHPHLVPVSEAELCTLPVGICRTSTSGSHADAWPPPTSQWYRPSVAHPDNLAHLLSHPQQTAYPNQADVAVGSPLDASSGGEDDCYWEETSVQSYVAADNSQVPTASRSSHLLMSGNVSSRHLQTYKRAHSGRRQNQVGSRATVRSASPQPKSWNDELGFWVLGDPLGDAKGSTEQARSQGDADQQESNNSTVTFDTPIGDIEQQEVPRRLPSPPTQPNIRRSGKSAVRSASVFADWLPSSTAVTAMAGSGERRLRHSHSQGNFARRRRTRR